MALLRTDSNFELRVRERMSPLMNKRDVSDEIEFEVVCVPSKPQPIKAIGNLEDFLNEDGMLVK